MKCALCEEKSIYTSPNLCKSHFSKYVEDKVLKTIKDFKLIDKNDKVCVAVSGGKDSTTVLFILKKFEIIASNLHDPQRCTCRRCYLL